ncbi:isocitrate/isopropylmalate dehydrogenase family protein [Candidatus Bathyarchaeota archaeon]|nr:isocitrate/isopropylmalate dehydrogenase family protein [Candidatus Bathyarchaeota archaeon]
MAKYKIAILPGDGIGRDVMDAARIVLRRLRLDAEYLEGDIGWEFWRSEGDPLPQRTLRMLEQTDVCLMGAITSKPNYEAQLELDPRLRGGGYEYYSPIVRLRQEFNLHTNIRPCKSYRGNPLNYREGIDIVVFRENTEGLYSGVEFHPLPQELKAWLLEHHQKMRRFESTPADEIAVSMRIMTKKACNKILTGAFEYARKRNYRTVTVVEKPNILRETGGLMLREAREVAKRYPEIRLQEKNIDAVCMWLLKNPLEYSVLVAENLFGDIVSDLCAQLIGGLGFAPSGNIGDDYAVFEPVHGSAPKYAGQYRANPLAMILSVMMMLEYLGEYSLARDVEKAVADVIAEGKVRTYDMGGSSSTLEMANAVADKISTQSKKA